MADVAGYKEPTSFPDITIKKWFIGMDKQLK